uniref:GGDEF domain-containing protein n=1 Tax=Pseudomonas phage vB_PaeS_FBPa53 TaxID=3231242 RepID=A0AAU8KTT7_9VIRU
MRPNLLEALRSMSEAELYAALYQDPLTGVLNRRAFTGALGEVRAVALVDLDSLKWINDNLGHRAGDQALQVLADALVRSFGADWVFRVSGDEFAVMGDSHERLAQGLAVLRATIPGFSFGTGTDMAEADGELIHDKARRERSGLRAARGLRPPEVD